MTPRPGPAPIPDDEIGRLRSGDRDAIEAVIRALLPRVRGWVFRLVGPRPEVDDLTQEVLAEIARSLPRFRGDASLGTFAHTIAARVVYRHLGRAPRSVELSIVSVAGEDPESRLMGREALRRLYRALDRLPRKRRMAFALCAIEGLSPKDAARIAGVTSVAMRSRLKHARAELRSLLSADPYLGPLFGEEETS
jgi:RNA polymerase sigma-70 factor (ECF subfamily)